MNKTREKTDSKSIAETITDRVHRHLRDMRSIITDTDIKNARVVIDVKANYYEDFLINRGTSR